MPPQRHRPVSHGGLYLDVLVVEVFSYLVMGAPFLLGVLLFVGGVVWYAFQGGLLWAGKPQGDLPIVLLMLVVGYVAICLYFSLKHYVGLRSLLQELGAQSLRCTRPGNYDDVRALARFAGAGAGVYGIARGKITCKGVSDEAGTATSSKGLLLTVFNRVYLIDWGDIERLLPSASDAGVWLSEGPLSGGEITIPWGADLEPGVPERLRQEDAGHRSLAAGAFSRNDSPGSSNGRHNHLDIVLENAVICTIGSMLLLLVLAAIVWFVFGFLLGMDFATSIDREPDLLWLIGLWMVLFWVLGWHMLCRRHIALLRWLEARALRFADRSEQVGCDDFRRRFVGEAIRAKAEGFVVRGDVKVPGEVIVFDSGLLLVTSRRAYLLAWRDIKRVLLETDQATLTLSGPAGIPAKLSVPCNAQVAEVVPRTLLPGESL